MNKKLPTFLLLLFLHQIIIAQTNRVVINGSVKNTSLKPILNTHVVNLTTGVGTISNKNGVFNIPVKEGDWLQISNIQFITKKIRLKKGNIKERFLSIHLIPVANVLEEAIINKKLKGDLTSDMIRDKRDTIREKVKSMMEIIMSMKHEDIMNMKIGDDERHMKKPKNAQLSTDPVAKFAGLPPETIGIPDYALIAKRARRKEISFKEVFPNKLLQIFGEELFFIKLKIPKDKYYNFLQYCSRLDIEKLFKEQKHIELLKILIQESAAYLLLLEKNPK